MRFIHTADWHLGRSFYNASLIDDQAYVLSQVIDLARDSKPDVVLIAGDIYDRAVPSTDAVKLLDEVLSRLILDVEVPVLLIAGNHDSPQRMQFAARLVESKQLYVFGNMPDTDKFIQMYDKAGAVCFYPMPYAEPSIVRSYLGDETIKDHECATRSWTNQIRQKKSAFARTVFVGHAFVVGGEESESERMLSVGGSGLVSSDCFEGFNYVALGHLHRRQSVSNTRIHYAGSLLKYSFAEAMHTKSVNLVEMDAEGQCQIEQIELRPQRNVRCIEGEMDELLTRAGSDGRGDFIKVTLLDKGAILDPMGKLRELYPSVMQIERPAFMNIVNGEAGTRDFRKRDMLSLFSDFYKEVTGELLADEHVSVFTSVIERMLQSEREASL